MRDALHEEFAPRPAWYAARRGGWRDWITVLHLPYTAWHLSYVLIGAALAPALVLGRLVDTLGAFGLAVGVAAHALDERHGHPLGTAISDRALVLVAALALLGATCLGVVGVEQVGWEMAAFIAVGVVLVAGYNLELFGGRLHNATVFAAAWGAFPVLTAYYAQTGTLSPAAVAGALFAFGLSRAQRVLSVDARRLRRHERTVAGECIAVDGRRRELTREALLRPLEQALTALCWAVAALAVALLLARVGR